MTRAHRTIQHFSKNTLPRYKTIKSVAVAVSPQEVIQPRLVPSRVSVRSHPRHKRRRPARPPASRPNRRTVLFNIASISFLSMLFSKNSGKSPRTSLRRTLPQRSQHRPGQPGLGLLNDHHLATLPFHQAVLFNVARFPTLSSRFRKIFRFFFRTRPKQTPESFSTAFILR